MDRLDRDAAVVGRCDTPLHGVLDEAADPVAADLSLGAIGVEEAHAEIGRRGRQYQHQAVSAGAQVAVAHRLRQRRPVPLLAR